MPKDKVYYSETAQ